MPDRHASMLDHLSRAVATRPAQPLPRLQPSPLPTLLRGRRAVGEHLDAVGAEDVGREVQQRQRRVLEAKSTNGSQLSLSSSQHPRQAKACMCSIRGTQSIRCEDMKCCRGSDLDWLRAVSTPQGGRVPCLPTGRHVDGRVEHSALGIVEVAERVPRSLVALTRIGSVGSGRSQKRVVRSALTIV